MAMEMENETLTINSRHFIRKYSREWRSVPTDDLITFAEFVLAHLQHPIRKSSSEIVAAMRIDAENLGLIQEVD